MKDYLDYPWKQIEKLPPHTLVHEFDYDLSEFLDENNIGLHPLNLSINHLKCVIIRRRFSLCAYIGVDKDCVLAGFDCDHLNIDCHGGLTFADHLDGFPDYFFYGWDYNHAGDRIFLDDDDWLRIERGDLHFFGGEQKRPSEIKAEILDGALYDIKTLIRFSDRLLNKRGVM